MPLVHELPGLHLHAVPVSGRLDDKATFPRLPSVEPAIAEYDVQLRLPLNGNQRCQRFYTEIIAQDIAHEISNLLASMLAKFEARRDVIVRVAKALVGDSVPRQSPRNMSRAHNWDVPPTAPLFLCLLMHSPSAGGPACNSCVPGAVSYACVRPVLCCLTGVPAESRPPCCDTRGR